MLGGVLGFFAGTQSNRYVLTERDVKTFFAGFVLTVWGVSVVAGIVMSDYTTPFEVHLIAGAGISTVVTGDSKKNAVED